MKRWLAGLVVLLLGSPAFAQSPPEISYDSVPDLLKLPPDRHLGEVAGVAVNSKGHIFVYSRGGSSHGPAFLHCRMSTAASASRPMSPGGRTARSTSATAT